MLLAAASMPLAACTSTQETAMASPPPAPAAPAEYQSAAAAPRDCASVGGSALTGAGVGGVGGLAVGGLAGAIWADANNDGCVDGYMREGRYYGGAPTVQPLPADYRSGERG
jgi:hypothetical protein